MDQVDIWNIIECFRENGLNTLEADTELNASRVEAIVTSIFSQLNKRIPVSRQVDIQMSVNMLLNWLLSAYDRYHIIQLFHACLVNSQNYAKRFQGQLNALLPKAVWLRVIVH